MPHHHDDGARPSYLARQPEAVDSAFAVLEAVAQHGPVVAAPELVEAVPLSRATVYRILKHLAAGRYLVRAADGAGFSLGPRVLALATHAVNGSGRAGQHGAPAPVSVGATSP